MLFLCEFEIFKDETMYVARPFGLLGATQGYDLRDACMMAHEWLQMEGEYRLMKGQEIPKLPLGNEPQEGGRILLVGAEVSLEGIDTVKASEAAEMLGVSRSRVSQMLKTSLLLGYRDGRDTYITRDSIKARLAERPKAGRPKKTADQRGFTSAQKETISTQCSTGNSVQRPATSLESLRELPVPSSESLALSSEPSSESLALSSESSSESLALSSESSSELSSGSLASLR